jgi:transketolase
LTPCSRPILYFNRQGFAIFDFNVYAFCGDGDMMEGVASEAASFAGHQMLGNLCWIYDSNRVTIEGHTDLAFSDDVASRFLSYGWNVQRVGDANDRERLAQAIERFRETNQVPMLIIVESHIGYGAPHKHDTSAAHGEPLGEEEVRLAKRSYGWPEDAKFLVPDGVREHFRDGIRRRGRDLRKAWISLFQSYRENYPELADQIERMQRRDLPEGWDGGFTPFKPEVILIGTGSEVALCVDAYEGLRQEGVPVRVVSMPSWELFEQQEQSYRDAVLPRHVTARVSAEMGSVMGWDRYVGATGTNMNTFGSSARLKDLLTKFGFTAASVVGAAKQQIAHSKGQAIL